MDKLILGRYVPGNSLVHRLDPRSKLIAMFLFIVIVFWANNLITNLLLTAFTLFLILLSRVKLTFFLKGLRSMFVIILFTTAFQIFFNHRGNLVWQVWIIKITDYGLGQAALIFMRFVLIICF